MLAGRGISGRSGHSSACDKAWGSERCQSEKSQYRAWKGPSEASAEAHAPCSSRARLSTAQVLPETHSEAPTSRVEVPAPPASPSPGQVASSSGGSQVAAGGSNVAAGRSYVAAGGSNVAAGGSHAAPKKLTLELASSATTQALMERVRQHWHDLNSIHVSTALCTLSNLVCDTHVGKFSASARLQSGASTSSSSSSGNSSNRHSSNNSNSSSSSPSSTSSTSIPNNSSSSSSSNSGKSSSRHSSNNSNSSSSSPSGTSSTSIPNNRGSASTPSPYSSPAAEGAGTLKDSLDSITQDLGDLFLQYLANGGPKQYACKQLRITFAVLVKLRYSPSAESAAHLASRLADADGEAVHEWSPQHLLSIAHGLGQLHCQHSGFWSAIGVCSSRQLSAFSPKELSSLAWSVAKSSATSYNEAKVTPGQQPHDQLRALPGLRQFQSQQQHLEYLHRHQQQQQQYQENLNQDEQQLQQRPRPLHRPQGENEQLPRRAPSPQTQLIACVAEHVIAEGRLGDLKPSELAILLWACAKGECYHARLMDSAVACLCEAMGGHSASHQTNSPAKPATDKSNNPAKLPTGELNSLAKLPTGELNSPAKLPTGKSNSPAQLPTGEQSGPAKPHTDKLKSQAKLPTVELNSPAKLPTGELNSPAKLPTGEQNGPAKLQTGEQNGPAKLPTGEQNGPAKLPTGEQNGPAKLPTGEQNGPAKLPTGKLKSQAKSPPQRVSSQDIANTAWAYAKLNHYSPVLMDALMQAALDLEAQQGKGQAKPQELCNLLWAMATLHHPHAELGGVILSQLEQQALAGTLAPQTISNATWAVARLGGALPCPVSFPKAMLAASLTQLRAFKPVELANLMWALAVVGHRTQEGDLWQLVAAVKSKVHLMQPAQLAQVAWAGGPLSSLALTTSSGSSSSSSSSSASVSSSSIGNRVSAYPQGGAVGSAGANRGLEHHLGRWDSPGRELAKMVGVASIPLMPQMRPQELAVISRALTDQQEAKRDVFEAIAEAATRQIDQFTPEGLANLLYAFAHSKKRPSRLIHASVEVALSRLHHFTLLELSTLLTALASMEHRDKELLDAAAQLIVRGGWSVPQAGVTPMGSDPYSRQAGVTPMGSDPYIRQAGGLGRESTSAEVVGADAHRRQAGGAGGGSSFVKMLEAEPQNRPRGSMADGVSFVKVVGGRRQAALLPSDGPGLGWATLARAFGDSKYHQTQLYDCIAVGVIPYLPVLDNYTLSRLLWSFASHRHRHAGLLDAVAVVMADRLDHCYCVPTAAGASELPERETEGESLAPVGGWDAFLSTATAGGSVDGSWDRALEGEPHAAGGEAYDLLQTAHRDAADEDASGLLPTAQAKASAPSSHDEPVAQGRDAYQGGAAGYGRKSYQGGKAGQGRESYQAGLSGPGSSSYQSLPSRQGRKSYGLLPTGVTLVAAAYAKLQHESNDLFDAIFAWAMIHQSSFNLKTWSRLTWSYSTLCHPAEGALFERLGQLHREGRHREEGLHSSWPRTRGEEADGGRIEGTGNPEGVHSVWPRRRGEGADAGRVEGTRDREGKHTSRGYGRGEVVDGWRIEGTGEQMEEVLDDWGMNEGDSAHQPARRSSQQTQLPGRQQGARQQFSSQQGARQQYSSQGSRDRQPQGWSESRQHQQQHQGGAVQAVYGRRQRWSEEEPQPQPAQPQPAQAQAQQPQLSKELKEAKPQRSKASPRTASRHAMSRSEKTLSRNSAEVEGGGEVEEERSKTPALKAVKQPTNITKSAQNGPKHVVTGDDFKQPKSSGPSMMAEGEEPESPSGSHSVEERDPKVVKDRPEQKQGGRRVVENVGSSGLKKQQKRKKEQPPRTQPPLTQCRQVIGSEDGLESKSEQGEPLDYQFFEPSPRLRQLGLEPPQLLFSPVKVAVQNSLVDGILSKPSQPLLSKPSQPPDAKSASHVLASQYLGAPYIGSGGLSYDVDQRRV